MDGSGETVRALLEVGADPNIVNSVGNTVMHEAVKQFMRGVLNELCQSRKVDYRKQNKDGFNPLHLAAHLGNIAAVQIILYYQPDVINLKDRNGNTALHLAALSKEKQVLEVLVAKKDLAHDVENDSGETALDLVIKGGNYLTLQGIDRISWNYFFQNELISLRIFYINVSKKLIIYVRISTIFTL